MAISHHLFDLHVHGYHNRISLLGPDFGYVSNDLDPSVKVTEVIILNKSWICLVVMRFRRLYISQMIHLMQEIHSTKNQAILIISKVILNFDLLH